MLEILYFFLEQFYNFIEFLDSVTLFGTVSILKILIILVLVKIVFVFLNRGKK